MDSPYLNENHQSLSWWFEVEAMSARLIEAVNAHGRYASEFEDLLDISLDRDHAILPDAPE